jgi:hypothetical protein
MKQLNPTRSYLAAAAGFLAFTVLGLASGGCGSLKPPINPDAAEDMRAADEPTELDRLNNLQVARGNRADATLRAVHFHRGALNSLGRQKLDQMMAAEEADNADAGGGDGSEMVVYLDVTGGRNAETEAGKRLVDARQDAVTDYLLSHGLTQDMFRLEMGGNPDDSFLATSAMGSAGAAAAGAGTTAPAGTAPTAPPAGGSTSTFTK